MLLPEPRAVPGGRQDGSKGEQLRDSDGEEGDDTPTAPVADELWGRKLRRLLEQHVGSEVRGRGCCVWLERDSRRVQHTFCASGLASF
jgi:hypothetical protein